MLSKNFCLDCKKEILPESKRCKSCGRTEVERIKKIEREKTQIKNICPGCKKKISKDAKTCRKCGGLNKERYAKVSKALKGRPAKPVSLETRMKLSKAGKGKIFTPETRKKIGDKLKAKSKTKEHIEKMIQSNLNNGRYCKIGTITTQGKYDYIKITYSEGGQNNWRPLHRYLIEKELGRLLEKNEQVHHIDGNTHNNDISNLVLLTNVQHNKINHFLGLLNGVPIETQHKIINTIKTRFPHLLN